MHIEVSSTTMAMKRLFVLNALSLYHTYLFIYSYMFIKQKEKKVKRRRKKMKPNLGQ